MLGDALGILLKSFHEGVDALAGPRVEVVEGVGGRLKVLELVGDELVRVSGLLGLVFAPVSVLCLHLNNNN